MFVKTTKEIAIYAGSKLSYGTDAKLSIEAMSKVTIVKPTDPAKDCSKTDEKIWEQQVTSYVKRVNILDQNLKTMCTIVCGQCTDVMWARLKSVPEFEQTRTSGDVIGLLGLIKLIVFSFAGEKYVPMAVFQATHRLYNVRQMRLSLSGYLDHFNNQLNVLHQCGGTLLMPSVSEYSALLEEVDLAACSTSEKKEVSDKAEQRLAAVLFLSGSNMKLYSQVMDDLHNDFIKGINSYPGDVSAAYRLLSHWQQTETQGASAGASGMAFATIGDLDLHEDDSYGDGFQF